MTTGFDLAGNMIEVHGERGNTAGQHRSPGGVRQAYRSLPAASFVLAYAAAEPLVLKATKHYGLRNSDGVPLGPGAADLVDAWAAAIGQNLKARARVVPQAGATTGRHRWQLLEGNELQDYLTDAVRIRNRVVHTGDPTGAKLCSTWFDSPAKRLSSMTLMLAEGWLQAAQDIAYQMLCSIMPEPAERTNWRWVLPARSAVSQLPKQPAHDPAFPLPI
jgi:hypothetical protein